MADRVDPTPKRPARNPGRKSAVTPDPELSELIEDERERLRRAEAILGCALIAMDEPREFPGARRVDYSSAVELARDLVKDCIDQLDAVRIGPLIEQLQGAKEQPPAPERPGPGFEVREPRPRYLS